MPSSQERSKVGLIINKVRNKARETRTILGGVELVARALRVMENTTTIRVKEVIITKMDGARDRTVIIMITLKILAVAEPFAASSILRLMLCAAAEPAEQTRATAMKTNIGKSFLIISLNPLRSRGTVNEQIGVAAE